MAKVTRTGSKSSQFSSIRPWRHELIRAAIVLAVEVFLLFLCVGTVAALVVNTGEREALLAFKAAVADPQGSLSSWNASSQPDPCLWVGVTCNSNRTVLKLFLTGAGISGPISPALRNLSTLRTLVLSNNNFSGPIPPELSEIGTLPTLSSPLKKCSTFAKNFVDVFCALLLLLLYRRFYCNCKPA